MAAGTTHLPGSARPLLRSFIPLAIGLVPSWRPGRQAVRAVACTAVACNLLRDAGTRRCNGI